MILKHYIALWDVIGECEIEGASDNSITHVKVNDIVGLIEHTNIKYIITLGKKADMLYKKYCEKDVGIISICLPSTSPANCAMSNEKLIESYKILKEMIKN